MRLYEIGGQRAFAAQTSLESQTEVASASLPPGAHDSLQRALHVQLLRRGLCPEGKTVGLAMHACEHELRSVHAVQCTDLHALGVALRRRGEPVKKGTLIAASFAPCVA